MHQITVKYSRKERCHQEEMTQKFDDQIFAAIVCLLEKECITKSHQKNIFFYFNPNKWLKKLKDVKSETDLLNSIFFVLNSSIKNCY